MGFIEQFRGGSSHIDDQPPEYQEPGPSTSNFVAPYPVKDSPATEFACLSINAMDRIRMCNFSEHEVSAIHDVARRVWPKGVDKVKSLGNAREIKLKGYPWHPVPTGNDDSRLLLLGILSTLYSMGWIIHVSMSFSHYATTDKDTLFFRRRVEQPPSPPCDWLCITFEFVNELKVVGDLNPDTSRALLKALGSRVASHELSSNCLQVKFHAHTWLVTGEDAVCTQFLMLSMVECLDNLGFGVYTTFENQTGLAGFEMDALICLRKRD